MPTSFYKSQFAQDNKPKGLLPYKHCVGGCVMSLYCLTNPQAPVDKKYAHGRYNERFYGFVCKHCGRVYFVTDGPLWENGFLTKVELVVALPEAEWGAIPRTCRRMESNMSIRVQAPASGPIITAASNRLQFECLDCHYINYSY